MTDHRPLPGLLDQLAAETATDGYICPIDPQEALECDSFQ